MVDHRAEIRVPLEHPAEVRQVRRSHERVKGEVRGLDRPETARHLGLEHPVEVRDVVNHRAQALEGWLAG
jgi:hypothetical protein